MILIGTGTFVSFWGMNAGLDAYESWREKAYLSNVGEKGPPFFFSTIEGKKVSSKHLDQADRYYLNFVLLKCGFCKEQITQLEKIAEKQQEKGYRFFNVVERADGKERGKIQDHFYSLAPHVEIVVDTYQRLRKQFNVTSFPTLVVLDGRGEIVKIIIGATLAFDKEFEELLSKKGN